jgi:type I restriction enzyme, S subunit
MSWREITLGEAIRVKHGYAFKGEFFAPRGSHLVVTPGNFHESGGLRVREGKERFYIGDIPEDFVLAKDDLIVAMTEQGEGLLGSSAWIPEDDFFLHNQRIGLISQCDETVLHKRYLYWLFNTPNIRSQIRASATGAKVKHTAPERLYKVRVSIPDIVEQEKITALLDNLDENQAVLLRQVSLLEEAARLIYTEWFVRLRFPGHESSLYIGELPQGWTKTGLMELAHVFTGYSFKGEFFNETSDGEPVIRIRDIPNQKTNTWSAEDCPPEYFVEEGDLLIGMDGFFHMANWAGQRGYLVQRVCRIRAKEPTLHAFLSLALERPIKHLEETIAGATVAHLGLRHLKEIDITLPPVEQLAKLKIFDDLLKQRLSLHKQIAQLRQARDLLLPRLISGQLRL